MASSAMRRMAHLAMPRSVKPRTIRFGLARGARATIDFNLDAAFYFGLHEPALHSHYRRLLKPGMKCFDVGMYRGWDALGFARLTGAEVVSFDGNAECLRQTEEFLAPSGARVTLVNAYLTDGTDGNLSIDAAAEQHFAPDFIKMDIEGAEATALRGASRVLAETRPSIVIETHGEAVEEKCVEILRGAGYEPQVVDRTKRLLSEARLPAHNRWLVCAGGA